MFLILLTLLNSILVGASAVLQSLDSLLEIFQEGVVLVEASDTDTHHALDGATFGSHLAYCSDGLFFRRHWLIEITDDFYGHNVSLFN